MNLFLSRIEARSRLMGRMMRLCGIEPVAFAQDRIGLTMASAARSCMACRRAESCRRWADAVEADGRTCEPPSFCPNAERFRSARSQ